VPTAAVPKPIQPTVQRVPNFPEVKRPERDANHPPFLEPGSELVETIIPPSFCACVGTSWGKFYLHPIYTYTDIQYKRCTKDCKVFYYELHKTKCLLRTLNDRACSWNDKICSYVGLRSTRQGREQELRRTKSIDASNVNEVSKVVWIYTTRMQACAHTVSLRSRPSL